MDRRRLAMAGVVAVSMGVGAVVGAVVFTPGVGVAAPDPGDGIGAAAAICADAISPGPLGRSPIGTAAEAIGIDASELLSELRDGRTIAEVAQAHGVEPADVVEAIVAERREWLDEAVADGRLTRAEADARIEALEGAVADLVRGDAPQVPLLGHAGAWGFADGPVAAAADAIGIRPASLLAELADGTTIAEVAQDRGVDVADVVDAVAGALRERLDAGVDAGWIDEAEADERAAELDDQAEAIVNGEFPPFPFPGFGRHEHGVLWPPALGGGWGAGHAEASMH